MVLGGYSAIVEGMASRLDVHLSCPVTAIAETSAGVRVTTASGDLLCLSLLVHRPALVVAVAHSLHTFPSPYGEREAFTWVAACV
jgi:hypothetical protein